jgi:hypothetical protein
LNKKVRKMEETRTGRAGGVSHEPSRRATLLAL